MFITLLFAITSSAQIKLRLTETNQTLAGYVNFDAQTFLAKLGTTNYHGRWTARGLDPDNSKLVTGVHFRFGQIPVAQPTMVALTITGADGQTLTTNVLVGNGPYVPPRTARPPHALPHAVDPIAVPVVPPNPRHDAPRPLGAAPGREPYWWVDSHRKEHFYDVWGVADWAGQITHTHTSSALQPNDDCELHLSTVWFFSGGVQRTGADYGSGDGILVLTNEYGRSFVGLRDYDEVPELGHYEDWGTMWTGDDHVLHDCASTAQLLVPDQGTGSNVVVFLNVGLSMVFDHIGDEELWAWLNPNVCRSIGLNPARRGRTLVMLPDGGSVLDVTPSLVVPDWVSYSIGCVFVQR
jgi:hypothetical protein